MKQYLTKSAYKRWQFCPTSAYHGWQKSQQVQGETLENLLEERLAALYPEDAIETIKAGAAGEDFLHSVYDENGEHAGNISWETKYRKNWSPKWLSKLARDARNSEASAAVLVSTVLPAAMEGKVAYIDGCWVCSVDAWEGLALVLRAQVLEVARLSTGLEQREDKAGRVYECLHSDKFRSARGKKQTFRGSSKNWLQSRFSWDSIDRTVALKTGRYSSYRFSEAIR